ncbi:TIGR01620 family protein [Bisgaard Taxon 45]
MNEKRLFTESQTESEELDVAPKREFHGEMQIEKETPAIEDTFVEHAFEHIVQPRSRWWKTGVGLTALLFFFAVIAQSIQWLVDTWQQNQWIYFAFSLVTCLVVLLGVSSLGKEWLRLVKLKKRLSLQQKSQQLLHESAVNLGQDFSPEKHQQVKALCVEMAQMLKLSSEDPRLIQWQKQLHDAYSAQEVAHLFSQIVLHPFDVQIKKLISKSAVEAAVIVAVSPLAVIDMFFLSWRNIRLVNNIAQIYGIELGYWSRLRLLKMVLLNLAFAGATEVVQDIGLDWLSQDLTAKLSARAAQGIGVGLLTARLGIKAMEFCRPLVFQPGEKPRLSHIQQELLVQLKSTLFRSHKTKAKQTV